MARSPSKAGPTHYQILQVHPAAPLDLITAAYWRLVGQAQAAAPDKASEVAVYHLTRSYQVLADPHSRAEYNVFLGIPPDQLPPHVPKRRKSSWVSAIWQTEPGSAPAEDPGVDYYELLRLDPLANPAIIAEAYTSIRNCYLRLVELGKVTPALVDLLEEAHENGNGGPIKGQSAEAPASSSDGTGRREGSSPSKVNRNRAKDESGASKAIRAKTQLGKKPVGKSRSVVHKEGKAAAQPSKRGDKATALKPVPERPADDNGRSSHGTAQDAGADAGATLRAVQSLALSSASALARGGKNSISVVGKASQMLRNIFLDVEPQTEDGLSPEEEEALLERLSQMPEATDPADPEPRSMRTGPLARVTLIGGPGLGREFEVEAVPFTLGEDAGCDIALPGLAAQQARLLHQNGHFILYSLSDEPGTSIHGESVNWAVLQHGDSFEIGPYQMRFDSV